jgi:RNA methyltransferase, TrmH family
VYQVSPAQLQALAATEHPAGGLAVVARPSWTESELWRLTGRRAGLGVLTVGVQDPGNLGTLIRTLAAAGGTGAWLGPGCAEAASPKVLRASAGSVLRLPVIEVPEEGSVLEEVHAKGWQTLAAVPRGGRPFTTCDLTRPTLFVLGGEGQGLAPDLVQACRHAVHIPMPGGTESLNVAVAGAILIYEAVRQRRLAQAPKRETPHASADPEPAH